MSKPCEPASIVSKRRSWSILIAWAAAIIVLAFLGSGLGRQACADVPGGARHALLAGRSDAGKQVRQHGPDRRPAARPARAPRPPGPAADGRAESDQTGPGALALGWVEHGALLEHGALAAPRPRRGLRARQLHPARERRDGGGAEHRSGDRPHRARPGAQLPDRRGGDRACDPGSHDGGHAARRADRAAGADPRAAARLPLTGRRRRAPRDGRRDRDGRPWPFVAGELHHADQLAGGRDRRDDEPRARRRLRAADGLARAPGARRRMGPRGGRGDRGSHRRAHDRCGGRHARADDARREQGRDTGPARTRCDRSRHLGPVERRAGAERDAGSAAPARPTA